MKRDGDRLARSGIAPQERRRDEGAQNVFEARRGFCQNLAQPLQPLFVELLGALAEDRHHQRALGAEVIVYCSEVDGRRGDDVAHRDAVEAAFGEQALGGEHDALAGIGGVERRRLRLHHRHAMFPQRLFGERRA